MNTQQLTRRMILRAAVVMMAAVALATGSADAAPQKHPDFESVADFKETCEAGGGEWLGEGNKISHGCSYSEGTFIHCEDAGKDCTTYPPRMAEPTGPFDSHVGTGGEATTEVGDTMPLAPVGDSRPPQDAQPVLEVVEQPVFDAVIAESSAVEPVAAVLAPVESVATEPVAIEAVAAEAAPVVEQP